MLLISNELSEYWPERPDSGDLQGEAVEKLSRGGHGRGRKIGMLMAGNRLAEDRRKTMVQFEQGKIKPSIIALSICAGLVLRGRYLLLMGAGYNVATVYSYLIRISWKRFAHDLPVHWSPFSCSAAWPRHHCL